jgi:hypothetical protein
MHREAMDHGMRRLIDCMATFSAQPWLLSEQGMRTAKLQTVIDAALMGSGP